MMLSLGYSQVVQGHAEHDKARFVSSTGINTGVCNNRFRPCKTVSYAAQNANKGDSILVAQGEYVIETEQDLLYFTGQIVPVLGGFDQVDQYQSQNPNAYVTSISGVPSEYASGLSQQGFKVIRDSKNLAQLKTSIEGKGLNTSQIQVMQAKQQNVDCVDGEAEGFACQNISLLAHLPLSDFPSSPSSASDIWGHVDLNTLQEYAIIGLRNAVAVVNVTQPDSPSIVGSVSGLSSTWRDVKVYQYYDEATLQWKAYAYATTEANEGLSIIDLNDLENGISLVRRQTTDASAHNIYISNVDYSFNSALANQTPAVHILGSNNFNGAFRSYTLTDPTILGSNYTLSGATRDDYTHDASSLTISDARAQTDCANSDENNCLVILDFNELSLRIWDHSNSNQTTELGASSYPNASYTHSGWWSEDKQYVIVHDELDEQDFNLNTTLNIFDISSLTTPTLVGTWTGITAAVDHNGFVRGNRYYMSNYERGLTVLDITDPTTPIEVGFFDTYPVSNNATFNGAWGVYPFLPSGNILVSDINSGLYILKDQTLDNDIGSISFNTQQIEAEEGAQASLTVTKTGSAAASVSYEILPGSANLEDIEAVIGELNWGTDDNQSQTISITTLSDSADEITESFFVRLFDPRNGATLTTPSIATVLINDALYQGQIVFSSDQIDVRETDGIVQVPVSRQGGSDGTLSVSYAVAGDTATLDEDATVTNGTLEWEDGDSLDKFIEINLIDDEESEAQEGLLISLNSSESDSLGMQNTLTLNIRDDESNLAPSVTAPEDFQVNTRQSVTLSGSGSDPEAQPLSYQWQQLSGTNVTLSNANTATANFTAPNSAATLEFSLNITDDFGVASSANVTVTVVATTTTETTSSSGGGSISLLILLNLLLLGLRSKTVENSSNQTR